MRKFSLSLVLGGLLLTTAGYSAIPWRALRGDVLHFEGPVQAVDRKSRQITLVDRHTSQTQTVVVGKDSLEPGQSLVELRERKPISVTATVNLDGSVHARRVSVR